MRFYFLALLLVLSVYSAGQTKEKLSIPPGKVGLIGYGSLLSKESMESTLGKAYKDSVRVVHVNGFERIWNYGSPNRARNVLTYFLAERDTIYPNIIISLNIQPSERKAINACLFIIDTTDMKSFDKRESGYGRINIKDKIRELEIVSGDVYAYKALPDFTIKVVEDDRKNIITASYVKLVEGSFGKLGADFEKEFRESTVPYSTKIVRPAGRRLRNRK